MQSSPPPPILYQAEYLLGCLERLAKKCGNVHTWGQEDSPFALPSDLPVPDYGDKEDLPWEDACIMAGIVGKHLHPLLFPTLPPSASQTSSPSSSTRPDLDPNSAAAMARDMVSEYLLSGTLVHTFLTLSAKDGPVVTRAAMRLLMASMHPSNFNLMIHK